MKADVRLPEAVHVLPALKDEAPSVLGRGSRVRDLLVIGQIALAVVLLTGASLLVRSARYLDQGPGFDATRVAILRLRPGLVGFDDARSLRFQEQAIQRIEAIPGVVSASPAAYPPLPGWGPNVTVSPADRRDNRPDTGLPAGTNVVGPRYFETLGLKPIRGRVFDAGDRPGSQPVVVLNETLARRLWSSLDAVGRYVTVGGASYQVVGVTPDAQFRGPARPIRACVYFNSWQARSAPWPGDARMLVRMQGDAQSMLPLLREVLRSVDPSVPVSEVARLSDRVRFQYLSVSAMRTALVWFGAVGTLLSAIGLYGLLTFTASLRAREMAIRVALGAMPRDLVRQLAARCATLLAVGVVVGLLSATAAASVIESLLYGVAGVDVMTLASVSVTLAAVSLLASYAPARRVASVDPASVFRST